MSGAGAGAGWSVAGAGVAGAVGLLLAHLRAGRDTAARTAAHAAERDEWSARAEEQVAQVRLQSWEWLRRYKSATARGRTDFAVVLGAVGEGRVPAVPAAPSAGRVPDDPFHAMELLLSQTWQEASADLAATARRQRDTGEDVIASIAPRLKSLVLRALGTLDDLERDTEDPDLLGGLFRVDHVTTLIRRYTESLLVLGGRPLPAGRAPVLLSTALRAAIAQTETFSRARATWHPGPIAIAPHAGPSVVHLLTELIGNALSYSEHQVLVTAQPVAAGHVIEIEDRGLGMLPERRESLNRLLAHPEAADVRDQLADGRIGLLVTALLAQQHGIRVELRPNLLGGTTAVVVVPPRLLVPVQEPVREPADATVTGAGVMAAVVDDCAAAPGGFSSPEPPPRHDHAPVPAGARDARSSGGESPSRPVLPQRTRGATSGSPAPARLVETGAEPGPASLGLAGAFSAGLRSGSGTNGPAHS
ncbi:ATP-binding protein [Streptomyces sp. NPDC051018]|uniref:ATP-binding protein n=1 Tax=Streptomyces sp. NPDC051018 TaxID=3365639 RepID=UPI0037A75C56